MTLAIGDGGNDIAMIQEAHVGVGISGKEGLQAARVADYSIAQFRFLQRLLFVHGHWNYIRTAQYVLLTFWKELLFYSIQIIYSKWNGYTGTSLYESDSLTVWNTLFTSLCVMLPAIFEQDLSATTLLAVPELYSYGQQSRGFNIKKYVLWMLMAACQSLVIYFMVYQLYGIIPLVRDQGLFALGDLPFSVCVIFINFNLLVVQYHYKTWIPLLGAFITIFGWWAWNLFLAAIYYNNSGPYAVYQGFLHKFGRDPTWWAVFCAILAVLITFESVRNVLKRGFWPNDIEVWQELEQNKDIKRGLEDMVGSGGYDVASRRDIQELLDRSRGRASSHGDIEH